VHDGRLMIEDNQNGTPDWAEASLLHNLNVSERMIVAFRMRFH
jgi:hypothetical protein